MARCRPRSLVALLVLLVAGCAGHEYKIELTGREVSVRAYRDGELVAGVGPFTGTLTWTPAQGIVVTPAGAGP